MTRTSDEIPQSEHNEHRMRRARSWLAQSKNVESDEEKFICLWIAFNAAYGGEPSGADGDGSNETGKINTFLRKVIWHDQRNEKKISNLLLQGPYYNQIQELLDNRYAFKTFWQYVRGESQGANWNEHFISKNDSFWENFKEDKVFEVFREVFWRLYQLRNQVFHGGVTFQEGWGRTQLAQGRLIMEDIVPAILDVMEENTGSDWGKVAYPRVGENPD